MDAPEKLTIALADGTTVSGLWLAPAGAVACLCLAHGAGVGMAHAAMAGLADGLAARKVATLRFQFPYMERGTPRPDPPPVAQAAVRAAAAEAGRRAGALPLFAGGRSYGGRMTAGAQAASPLDGVRGLIFFAFPLHPAGQPGESRAAVLASVTLPMLFLQGTRDELASLDHLRPVVAGLGDRATLVLAEDADHGFHVRVKSGRTDAGTLAELLDAAVAWMAAR
jgi:predicted alpha/beta-hydrolase family hydrolase